MASEVSSLIKDLSNVPSIVGSLGLSIAAAQKELNLDYLKNLEKLVVIAKDILGNQDNEIDKAKLATFSELLKNMVLSLAPSRYQFTETTLKVKLDLAQTMSKSEQMGFGINTGAVAINVAMTSASGYDAHSAAEVTTVLHAISPNLGVFTKLLEEAGQISDEALTLPAGATIDQNIVNASGNVFEKLVGKRPKGSKKPTTTIPTTGG